jgi:ribonuclease P protein component
MTKNKKFSLNFYERLHTLKDFNTVFNNGYVLKNEVIKILVYIKKNPSFTRRMGIITSRRIGTAVLRNKIKRRIREIFRINKYLLIPKVDLIFIPNKYTTQVSYNVLKKNIIKLLLT